LPALAGSASSGLSLAWILAQVRANNPEVKAARAEVGMAKAMITSSRSWPDPQIGVEFWDVPRPGLDLASSDSKWLDFSQDIPFPTTTLLQSKVATHEMLLKQVEAEKTLQEQLFMAKQAFWDLYTASESLKTVSRTVQALNRLLGLSRQRGRLGQVGRMEQLMDPMAKMERVGLENQALGLRQERLDARARLARLTAMDLSDAVPDPSGETAPHTDGISGDGILGRAMESRPAVMEAEHHLLHMKAQQALTASGWLPDLMLQYSMIANSNGPQTSMAMVKVNLPFIWFWRQASESKAAGKDVEASQAMLNSTMDETTALVRSDMAELQTAREQLKNDQTEAISEANDALNLGISGYQAGSVGLSDALGAVRAYCVVHLEIVGLTAQIGRSVADLESLVGGSLDSNTPMEMGHDHH
jgi:outer membrane protein TolC